MPKEVTDWPEGKDFVSGFLVNLPIKKVLFRFIFYEIKNEDGNEFVVDSVKHKFIDQFID
jgi:hypothetical protein